MTTCERIIAESKGRGDNAIKNMETPSWMKENAKSRIISSVAIKVRAQHNVNARGAIAPAISI